MTLKSGDKQDIGTIMSLNSSSVISKIRRGFDSSLPIPKYYQIKEIIGNEIRKNSILPGAQLPSVCILSNEFGITTVTANRVLRELENEGLAKRIRGRGTFVPMGKNKCRLDGTVSVVFPWSKNNKSWEPLFGPLIHGIEEGLHAAGYEMIYADSKDDIEIEKIHVERLSGKTEGLIIGLPGPGEKVLRDGGKFLQVLNETGVPYVLVDKHFDAVPSCFVETDNRLGAKMAVSHMLGRGCRRIGCIFSNETLHCSSVIDRIKGYDEDLSSRNLASFKLAIPRGDPSGKAKISDFVRENRLEGVFALENWMAELVVDFAIDEGIDIPGKLNLVSFDLSKEKSRIDYPKIIQPMEKIGLTAVEMLLRLIRKQSIPETGIYLKPSISIPEADMPKRKCGKHH